MKFKKIYDVIEERRSMCREQGWKFIVSDHSPINVTGSGYVDRMRPLWIIVEDHGIGLRVWIIKEFGIMYITTKSLSDSKAKSSSIIFSTQGEMAGKLRELFQLDSSAVATETE